VNAKIEARINELEKMTELPADTNAKVYDGLRHAVAVIEEALQKMKTAGVPASKAALEAPEFFRSLVRKQWGSDSVDFESKKGHGQVTLNATFGDLPNMVGDLAKEILSN